MSLKKNSAVSIYLIHQLQGLKERRNGTPAQLVFPNSKGKPDSENDMIVKRVAERAKLNCGQCITKHGNKCSDGPHWQHFFLHKFRHTFATEHLRHGVDIRILQIWMGYRRYQVNNGLPERRPIELYGQD